MNQSERGPSPEESLVVAHPEPGTLYSLETVAHLTGASRRGILVYCRSGLVRPSVEPDTGPMAFDDEAIYLIRRAEYLRNIHGINLTGVRIIIDLMREVHRLRDEMRDLRP